MQISNLTYINDGILEMDYEWIQKYNLNWFVFLIHVSCTSINCMNYQDTQLINKYNKPMCL